MKTKKIVSLLIFGLSLTLLSACGTGNQNKTTDSSKTSKTTKKVDINKLDFPQLDDKVTKDEYLVKMKTGDGEIQMKLFPKQAPLAVENFVTHAEKGYYNGTTFHRVIKEFMIQGGDPKGDGSGGESIWKGKNKKIDKGNGFKNEISKQLYNLRGALSMAHSSIPNSNGSQFFIVQNDEDVSDGLLDDDYPKKIIQAYKKGGVPYLDGDYTVFGQVTSGMDVVDKIANGEIKQADSTSATQDQPVNPVKIDGIEILQKPKK